MESKKVAIVLSGGGSKGAYQIGVWKALRKQHIKYDIVTGTSVGAINGLMMVQKDYHKAFKLWTNIDYSFIFKKGKFDEGVLEKNKVYLTYAKEFIREGGMDVSNLEKVIKRAFNSRKFWFSPINYGLVVYNLDKLKAEYKIKDELKQENIISYVLASSACYPAFKKKKIGDDEYVDGGFYDYMPINLAIDMGATDIISIDLKAPGIKQPIKKDNVNIVRIYPKNQLASFLMFDAESSKKAINYGYNDAMKSFGKLSGNIYSFKRKSYDKYIEKIYLLLKNKMTKKQINTTIEYLGSILNVDDTKIYRIKKYNRIVKSRFSEVDNLNYNAIKKKINNKEIKDLLNTKYIVKYIYSELKVPKNNAVLQTLFRKEYLAAVYIKMLEGVK